MDMPADGLVHLLGRMQVWLMTMLYPITPLEELKS